MKKFLALTALTIGLGALCSTAFADQDRDGHDWHERDNGRRHVIVEREYYHGPHYYRPYAYHPYGTYVEPVEPVYYAPPQPVYYTPPPRPVYYAPQPALSIGVRL